MSDSASGSLPLLLEDGSRLDWLEATYRTDVTIAGAGRATVRHVLSGAQALRRLIDDGKAKWAVEVRCPKTLMARTVVSCTGAHQTITWDANDVDGEVFLVPGLVVLDEKTALDTSELSSIWQERADLHVPPGWWLAKGDTAVTDTLMQSLLKFQLADPDDLGEGQMEVSPDRSGGALRFIVKMAPDVFEAARTDRTLQVAALVGACGWFPRVFKPTESSDDDEEWAEEEPLAQQLRSRIEENYPDATLWEDATNYDPALVATQLEPFRITREHDQDDE